jgi:hypothetical protein
LHTVVWDWPVRLGKLAGRIGGVVDDSRNWLIGMVIIIAIALVILGLIRGTQLLDVLCLALGLAC